MTSQDIFQSRLFQDLVRESETLYQKYTLLQQQHQALKASTLLHEQALLKMFTEALAHPQKPAPDLPEKNTQKILAEWDSVLAILKDF